MPPTRPTSRLGFNVARVLSGAWKDHVGLGTSLSEPELNEITSPLCRLGAGALAWYKIRNTSLQNTLAGQQLHEVYRRQRLSALLHERDLVEVLTLFRAEGIEAVLVKGWAIARRYPDPALRSYGDLDLCVAPAQFAKAQAVLKRIQTLDGPFVDLHSGFGKVGVGKQLDLSRLRKWFVGARDNSLECGDLSPLSPHATRLNLGQSGDRSPHSKELDGNSWDELYARSQFVTLEARSKVQSPKTKDQSGFPVRILSDEDHLRKLCLHLLRSGARRPAWLCDVAVIIDGLRSLDSGLCSSFDWEICLGRNPVHAEWVGIAVRLAHELLGVDISQTPFADLQLPSWLAPAVLKEWSVVGGQWPVEEQKPTRNQSRRALRALFARWNNPIRAVAAVGGQFDERSRLRYRVAELIARTPEVPDHLRRLW